MPAPRVVERCLERRVVVLVSVTVGPLQESLGVTNERARLVGREPRVFRDLLPLVGVRPTARLVLLVGVVGVLTEFTFGGASEIPVAGGLDVLLVLRERARATTRPVRLSHCCAQRVRIVRDVDGRRDLPDRGDKALELLVVRA